jgi:hypothetical protein
MNRYERDFMDGRRWNMEGKSCSKSYVFVVEMELRDFA